jgi:beta-glucanase (GH16 family)/glycerophosphoryl diester phosphodiesterase
MGKSKGISIAILVLSMIFFSACVSNKTVKRDKIVFAKNSIVAHRGAWKKNNLPENSIASLKHAIELKCTGSEFDVRMTADDSLIINHDPHYNNLTIETTTYADLIQFKLSNGEKLPTLREYILAGIENNSSTRLVCEIKPSEISKERGQIIATKVVQMFQKLNADDFAAFISFDYDILKKIRALNPLFSTQYLEADKSPEQVKADGISGLDYHFSVFKDHPEWIESAKKNNSIVNAWTVNDIADMDWLIANGFDFITTNEPELLQERIKLAPVSNGMKLVWSDEFNTNGLPDSSKWSYEVGGHGWGNNELQYYTNADALNTKVDNGILKITVLKQDKENRNYTSARLVTNGKAEFLYGKIEIRAKLPAGRGLWPAIWLLGNNYSKAGWPKCGEIDIMEHVGFEKDSVFGTIHSEAYNHIKGTQKGKKIFVSNPYNQFHDYSIEWTPETIDFMLDGQVYNHIVNEHKSTSEWPFEHPFYLIMNVAVGGNLGGKQGLDENVFPATMEIDYVRFYKTTK